MAQHETHDLGRLYVHTLTYPVRVVRRWPWADIGTSHEAEEPWRIGRCVVLRLPFSLKAAVVGWWGPKRTYEQLLEDEDTAGTADVALPIHIRDFRRPA